MLSRRFFKTFCEQTSLQVKKEQLIPKSFQLLNPNITKLTENELQEIQRVGADVVIPNEVLSTFKSSGLFHEEHDLFKNREESSLLKSYIDRQNLLFDYSEIFRDFMQSIARNDFNYLNLVAEANLANTLQQTLDRIRKKGFYIELESLRNKHQHTPLEATWFKNLRINRYKNLETLENLDDLKINKLFSGVYNAHVKGRDTSIFENNKPFIFSCLVKVTTPMKLSVYNQNLSLKLYGKEKNEDVSYYVKFETEMSYTETLSVIRNPNKQKRTRQTRIADINNILNGNPFKSQELFSIIQEARAKNFV